jgi:hypothetical protein
MSAEKKPFSETGLGKFLGKAGQFLPNVVDVAGQLATGNISGAIGTVTDSLKQKAESNAEAARLLQELELHHMQWVQELERIHAADRASARDREVALAATGNADNTPRILAFAGVAILASIILILAFVELPEKNRDMFMHLQGALEGGVIMAVFQYYFGSSMGSKQKTDLLVEE